MTSQTLDEGKKLALEPSLEKSTFSIPRPQLIRQNAVVCKVESDTQSHAPLDIQCEQMKKKNSESSNKKKNSLFGNQS